MKYIVLLLLAALFLFPLYWMATLSVQTRVDAVRVPPDLFPRAITLSNYAAMLSHPVLRWAGNTVMVVAGTTLLSVAMSALAGYAFVAFRFPFKEVVFWLLMAGMMITRYALFIPSFVLLSRLHLFGIPAVVLSCLFSPFGIYLFRSYMQSHVPGTYAESARMDGAGELSILRHIMAPLCAPVIAAMVVFKAVETLQDYIWQMLLLQREDAYTLVVGLMRAAFETQIANGYQSDYAMEGASSVLMLIPIVLVFAFTSRYFVRGLGEGGLKG